MLRVLLRLVAIFPGPTLLIPVIGLAARDLFGQIHAFQPAEAAGFCDQRLAVYFTVGMIGYGDMRGPLLADHARQAAGIDTTNRNAAAGAAPV